MCVWNLSAWRSRILLILSLNHAETQSPGCISAKTAVEFPLGNVGDVVFGFLSNNLTLQMKLFKWLIFIFIQKFTSNNLCFFMNSNSKLMCQVGELYQLSCMIPLRPHLLSLNYFPPLGRQQGLCALFLINPFLLAQHLCSTQISFHFVSTFCFSSVLGCGLIWFHSEWLNFKQYKGMF